MDRGDQPLAEVQAQPPHRRVPEPLVERVEAGPAEGAEAEAEQEPAVGPGRGGRRVRGHRAPAREGRASTVRATIGSTTPEVYYPRSYAAGCRPCPQNVVAWSVTPHRDGRPRPRVHTGGDVNHARTSTPPRHQPLPAGARAGRPRVPPGRPGHARLPRHGSRRGGRDRRGPRRLRHLHHADPQPLLQAGQALRSPAARRRRPPARPGLRPRSPARAGS
ncbi:hypothetical protein [Ornithinimicrobium kibberense]|uniref:hypothetical protein n=1 Tax=Ornithinimicrobium kibberense TaxID=282060 RepID=UPI00361267A8